MLLLAFCLSFCSFGVGVAYADDVEVSLSSKFTVNFIDPEKEVTFPNVFSLTDDWINNPVYYAAFTSFMQQLGTSRVFNSNGVNIGDFNRYDNFSIPVLISKSGLELTDLSFEYPLIFYFVKGSGSSLDYLALSPQFTGVATVNFSDGSSKKISLTSNSSISFSAKKELFGDEYIMTSEDFSLKSNDDKQFSLASNTGKLSAKTASLSSERSTLNSDTAGINSSISSISGGQFSGSGLPNSVELTKGSQIITIPVPGELLPQMVYVPIITAASFSSASFLNSSISGRFSASLASFSSGLASFVLSNGDFSVTAADFSVDDADMVLVDGVVDESLVRLNKASSDVYVTGFSISGNLYFPAAKFVPSGSLSYPTSNNFSTFLFTYNLFASYGESENMLAHIAATLDGIYYTLRFDLPLRIRHLLIPTTEEVSDVVEGAVNDIKNNAGGLGEAVGAVENDIKEFQNILAGGKPGSLKIPSAVVNVNGQSYKLWDEFDVSPYFQLKPIKDIVSYVVPFLEFLVASFVIYQLYYMWISILSGNSYFAYLKNIPSLNSEEGD